MITLILLILLLVADILLAKKLEFSWWTLLIPGWGQYKLCQKLYGNGWYSLGLLVPVYNVYFAFKMNIDLGLSFDFKKNTCIVLTFLNIFCFFNLVAGLSSRKYNQLANAPKDAVAKILAGIEI